MSDTKIEPSTDDDDEPPVRAELRLVFVAPSSIVSRPSYRLLDKTQLTIGRKPTCGIPIDSASVSEHHATVSSVEKEDSWEVELTDCGSTNGTTVNGTRIKSQQLRDGDIVGIGSSYLVFRVHQSPDTDCSIPSIIGCSPEIRQVRHQIEVFAPTPLPVLLQGETGVGKEVVAKALHTLSGRRGPHVPYNCAGLLETLAESTLFGHIKGAFSGAHSDQTGLFEEASNNGGGTLFLDEVAELDAKIQPKLLRAIENRTYYKIGIPTERKSSARLITGTKTNLRDARRMGLFRDDLYHRITVVMIHIPSLRRRREDILPLVQHFLGNSQLKLSASLARELLLHPWPGNVRELKQTIEKTAVLAQRAGEHELRYLHCRDAMKRSADDWKKDDDEARPAATDLSGTQSTDRQATEPRSRPSKEEFVVVLNRCNGKILRAAHALGVDRKTIRRWIEHYELGTKTPEE